DLIARCVAEEPGDRYLDAASLADDLRRHLADRPLVGVPNRSPIERWAKWRRRRPGALGRALVAAALLVAVLGAGAAILSRFRHQADEARAALADGRAGLDRGDLDG